MNIKQHAHERFRERIFNNTVVGGHVCSVTNSDVICMLNCFIDRVLKEQEHFLVKYKSKFKHLNRQYSNSIGIMFDKLGIIFVCSPEMTSLFTIRKDTKHFYKLRDTKQELYIKQLWEETKEHGNWWEKTNARIALNNNYDKLWQCFSTMDEPDDNDKAYNNESEYA